MSVNIERSRYKSRIHHRVEILLNNLVDKDVQAMVTPLNIMQFLTLCSKYRIKDNFITPNCRVTNLVSLFGTLLYLAIIADHTRSIYNRNTPTVFLITQWIDICIHVIGFVVNFVVCVMCSDHNVMLVLSIQDVHRLLNDEVKCKSFNFWNWFLLFFLNIANMSMFFYFNISTSTFSLDIEVMTLLVFDFNIIYAIRILRLLESKVVLWNIEVLKSQQTEEYNLKMFNILVKIYECYELYKACFEYLVSNIIFIFRKKIFFIDKGNCKLY